MSPAAALFTQLRSYPRNAGEIEGAKRVLWGVLGRVADAVHQVLKRLAALKVRVVGMFNLLEAMTGLVVGTCSFNLCVLSDLAQLT